MKYKRLFTTKEKDLPKPVDGPEAAQLVEPQHARIVAIKWYETMTGCRYDQFDDMLHLLEALQKVVVRERTKTLIKELLQQVLIEMETCGCERNSNG